MNYFKHIYYYWHLVSDIAIFVLKSDVKLQLTNYYWHQKLESEVPSWAILLCFYDMVSHFKRTRLIIYTALA